MKRHAQSQHIVQLILISIFLAINLAIFHLASAQTANTITINRNTTYQTIWGFGAAANHPVVHLYTKFSAANQAAILDKLFGTTGSNAGLSIVRLEINPFSTASQDPNGASQLTFEPYDGVWDWNTDQAQRWFAQEAINRGGGDVHFMAVPWSPPGWMKTNNSPTNGGYLRTDMYTKFQNYILAYLNKYRNEYGFDIRWLSLQNEPTNSTSYASCQYTNSQMSTVAALIADSVHAQFPGVLVGAPEGATRSISAGVLNGMTSASRAKLDFIVTHDYGGANSSLAGFGKPVINTEVWSEGSEDTSVNDAIRWANAVKDALNRSEPGWLYWWLLEPTDKSTPEGLIYLYSNGTYSVQRRLYAIGQFSRFMQYGDVRISTSSSNSSLNVVAAKDNAGRAALVVINGGTSSITSNVTGLSGTALAVYRTSATENLAQVGNNVAISNGLVTWTFPPSSITTLVEVAGGPTPTPSKTPTSTNTPPPGTVRIEAGGTANYTDPGGNVWLSDRGFTGGSVVDRGSIAIANTTADRVYQTERWGMSAFAYAVSNGTYQVNLHFAETYTGITAAGQRVFSVNVEGTVINGIDVYAEAGGRNIALIRSVTVTVTDGTLNMTFATTANSAEINGIEIIPGGPTLTPTKTATASKTPTPTNTATATTPPPPGTVRIEAGGSINYTDPGGNVWLSDRGFTGGSVVDRGSIAIANTMADRVYQTERWGMSAFAYAVSSGTYQVNLHFAETYTGITAAGQRVFSVNVEGTTINGIDIYAEAGGRNIALIRSVTVTVTDGVLNITFAATMDNAEINGIEIVPGG